MSNSLKNLLIVLVISGAILYLINRSPKIVSEKFSMLSTLVSDTNSLINGQYNENTHQLVGEEISDEEISDEEISDEEEHSFRPTEEESNYAQVSGSNQDFVLSDINQSTSLSSTKNVNVGQRIDSNISSNLINNMESEEEYSEADEEQYRKIDQKLDEEEDFRKYLSSGKEDLDEDIDEELGKEIGEEEYAIKPYAEEELSQFLISNEEEESRGRRGLFQEEEESRGRRGLFQEEEESRGRRGLFQEEEERIMQENNFGEEENNFGEEENNFGEEENNFGEEENNFGEEENNFGEEESNTNQEMKNRFKHQVKCGTFIEPKYNKRISGCGTKSQMKLYKPMNKKLNDLRNSRSDDMPKSIRDLYNESVPDLKETQETSTCQHVQKGVTMNACSNNFSVIGEETSTLDGNLYANDNCFDPYSTF
uniref:Uncharacterized protein n=1 Tax=viral metagenome TaxID=1070528 RepID=A0A6C0IV83_9ZZZZ